MNGLRPPDPVVGAPRSQRAWVSTTFRFLLAAVWAAAAVSNLLDHAAGARSLRSYHLLPAARVDGVAWGLVVVETGLAVVLVAGLATRAAAVLSALLLALFVGAIASAWVRGLPPDCACAGAGSTGSAPVAYVKELVRDTAFLALAAWLAAFPASRRAVAAAVPGRAGGPIGAGR
jgi:uncharacterized membrane protein YphA (DoxX/SURF4 family)